MDTKIFDTLLEPVFILNNEKQVIYCNEPAGLICDISPRKLVRSKQPFDQIFQFATPVEHLNSLASVSEPTAYQEVSFQVESGKTGKVQITFQPFGKVGEGETQQDGWIAFFRDVTLEETLQKKYRAELEQKEDVILDLQKAQAELEKYSKNLEQMVEERTAQIKKLNQMMAALLDSLGQGFFIFDQQGLCLEIASKACENTVESKPPGQKIWDVLKLSEKQVPGFQKWMQAVYAEMLPFEDMAPLAPQTFPHSAGQHIKLEYYPLRRSAEGGMDGVVVVATDITQLIQAQQEAEIERAHAKMIVSLIQHKRHVVSFLQESESLLKELKTEFQKQTSASAENLFRILHTLKGGAASFSIKPMADQAHLSESLLTEWKSEPAVFEKLKDSSLKIEGHFQHFAKENEQILGSPEKLKQRWVEISADKLHEFQSQLPAELKPQFLKEFLMESIGSHFTQYDEVIKAVAEREMKALFPLKLHNPELPVLPEAYSQLFSTFIHQFRNAVDHGIESGERRQELGKPVEGQIEVFFSVVDAEAHPYGHMPSANEAKSFLLVEVKDDGGGVDPAKIRARLEGKGVSTAGENDDQVIQHIFDSQFSTKDVVTETSGRGVGMDAILHSAKKLGGTAWVKSQVGKGTSLFVKVPYITEVAPPAIPLKKVG